MTQNYLIIALYETERGAEKARSNGFECDKCMEEAVVAINSNGEISWSSWSHPWVLTSSESHSEEKSQKVSTIAETVLGKAFDVVSDERLAKMRASIQSETLFAMGLDDEIVKWTIANLLPGRSVLFVVTLASPDRVSEYLEKNSLACMQKQFKWDDQLIRSILHGNISDHLDFASETARYEAIELAKQEMENSARGSWLKRLLSLDRKS